MKKMIIDMTIRKNWSVSTARVLSSSSVLLSNTSRCVRLNLSVMLSSEEWEDQEPTTSNHSFQITSVAVNGGGVFWKYRFWLKSFEIKFYQVRIKLAEKEKNFEHLKKIFFFITSCLMNLWHSFLPSQKVAGCANVTSKQNVCLLIF